MKHLHDFNKFLIFIRNQHLQISWNKTNFTITIIYYPIRTYYSYKNKPRSVKFTYLIYRSRKANCIVQSFSSSNSNVETHKFDDSFFLIKFSAYDTVVPARGKALVKTDIQIEVPFGTYGRVAPRSGLAWKNFIDVGAGVIDQDYRGNVGVILFNHSDVDFDVKKGDRIAQLICESIVYPNVVEAESLTETVRGEGGFGSTGTK